MVFLEVEEVFEAATIGRGGEARGAEGREKAVEGGATTTLERVEEDAVLSTEEEEEEEEPP